LRTASAPRTFAEHDTRGDARAHQIDQTGHFAATAAPRWGRLIPRTYKFPGETLCPHIRPQCRGPPATDCPMGHCIPPPPLGCRRPLTLGMLAAMPPHISRNMIQLPRDPRGTPKPANLYETRSSPHGPASIDKRLSLRNHSDGLVVPLPAGLGGGRRPQRRMHRIDQALSLPTACRYSPVLSSRRHPHIIHPSTSARAKPHPYPGRTTTCRWYGSIPTGYGEHPRVARPRIHRPNTPFA